MIRWLTLSLLLLPGCLGQSKPSSMAAARAHIGTMSPAQQKAGLILVSTSKGGQVATLRPIGLNRGVRTWLSPDQVSLSYHGGVLVATRGLGGDLMAADFVAPWQAKTNPYQRRASFLNAENQIETITLTCRATTQALREIRGRLATRTDERCGTSSDPILNSFWRLADGTVWITRQWVSDPSGYLTTELISSPPGAVAP
ncbi:YjbF family lipoprotein [uncultured Aliiroseovarius sp.]|uniref:YjbF family lipoprotein n=1 Tax=uncultured Aliiroseovarius sp. TaxID=1658783 RepID=UPI00260858BC|nr:YjbF family lipoprotein [uncultured Aliiroseovarius sp.]